MTAKTIRCAARHRLSLRNFSGGGNAIFTVSSISGERYTFKIRRPDESKPFFVGLLAGPDNENSYVYMGLYRPETGEIVLTRASKFKPDSKPVRVVQWAINTVRAGKVFPDGYACQHEGKCCVCGRTLTVPESIESGIGPECAKRFC